MRKAVFCVSLNDSPKVLSASDGVSALLGFSPNDFVSGRVGFQYLIDSVDANVARTLFSPDTEARAGTVDLHLRCRSGEIRHINAEYTKGRKVAQGEVCLVVVMRDAEGIEDSSDEPLLANSQRLLEHTGDDLCLKNCTWVGSSPCGSKGLLEVFVEQAPVALAMFDREMRYLAASRRWRENYALVDEELFGRSHYEVVPDFPERWKEVHLQGLAGKALRIDEDRFERADGTIEWIRWEIVPWRTNNESVGGILLFAEDITPRKQIEEHLKLAASVFTHAPEGIMITDAMGVILDVNDAFTRITGYSRGEVMGRTPSLLKPGLFGNAFSQRMWRSLLENDNWSGEIFGRSKNGRPYAVILKMSAVRDENQNVFQYVAFLSDITELKEKQRQLEKMTHYDQLTGLPNRLLLADRLRQAIAHSVRRKRLLAVAYLDLDGFKEINERYGRVVGDQMLANLARRMKRTLREVDTLARVAGDEFVALLTDLPEAGAALPALSRLLNATSRSVWVGELPLRVSASIGVAYFPQAETIDADQLLRLADHAMYQAKLEGGDRYHVFEATSDTSIRGSNKSAEYVRHALINCQLALHYQPKVNMRSGEVIGAEALLRVQDLERGLLSPGFPGEFLPVMEDHPLTIEIGEWVIERALTQIEDWQASGLDLPVSVNINSFHLQQPNFIERLRAMLGKHPRVKPSSLELEVLESGVLRDITKTSDILEKCHRMGVSIALDDFGTGYSSLTYLKQLPADFLKIDRSFVSGMLNNPEDLTIVEGVLSLAAAFGRKVIAEGVETSDHALMLLQFGCEVAQGYTFARPMPASDFPTWLDAWRPDPRWVKVRCQSNGKRRLLYAGVEHRALLADLESFIQGKRSNPPPLDLHECRFTAWINSKIHSARGTLPTLHDLASVHSRFHRMGVDFLASLTPGKKSNATGRLAELRSTRDELFKILDTLSPQLVWRVPAAHSSMRDGKTTEFASPEDFGRSHRIHIA